MPDFKPPESFKIGDVYLARRVTVRNTRFPQQNWYEDVTIQAGRYPIYATEVFPPTMEVVYHTTYIQLQGFVETDYFPITVLGIPIGVYNKEKNKGSASGVRLDFPTYVLAKAALEEEGKLSWLHTFMTVRLDPSYTPIRLVFIENAQPKEVYCIIKTSQ